MFRCDCLSCLEFTYKTIFNQQISVILAYLFAIVMNGYRRLLLNGQSCLLEFDKHGILVDLFHEAGPEHLNAP